MGLLVRNALFGDCTSDKTGKFRIPSLFRQITRAQVNTTVCIVADCLATALNTRDRIKHNSVCSATETSYQLYVTAEK